MTLTDNIKEYIDNTVLCWLATVSQDGQPNVSPKELFHRYGDDQLIIANIASPQSVNNIKQNPKVCVSILDILVQKGFQLKGTAQIIDEAHKDYDGMYALLTQETGDKYPFHTITVITVQSTKPIIAPSYWLFPDITEEDQIASAKQVYGLK